MVNTLTPTALAALPAQRWQPLATIAQIKSLRRNLLLLRQVIPKRPQAPILANILLETSPGGALTLSAFDLEQSMQIVLPRPANTDIFQAVAGQITLPSELLIKWTGTLTRQDAQQALTIQTGADQLALLEHPGGSTALQGMTASEFPLLPTPERDTLTAQGSLDLKQLAVALVALLPSTSHDPKKALLQGVNWRAEGDGLLLLTATSGTQISQYLLDCPPALHCNVTIDRRFLALLVKVARDKHADHVNLAISADRAYFHCTTKGKPEAGSLSLSTRLLEGAYPYLPNLSELWTTSVDRRWLLNQLEIAIQCGDGFKPRRRAATVRLDSNAIAGDLTVTGNWSEGEKLMVAMQATITAEAVLRSGHCYLNCRKLYRILKGMRPKTIRLALSTPIVYEGANAGLPAVVVTAENSPFVHAVLAVHSLELDFAPTGKTQSYAISLPEPNTGAVLIRPLERQHTVTLASPRGALHFSLKATNATIEALRDRASDGMINLTRAEIGALYAQRDSKPKTSTRS